MDTIANECKVIENVGNNQTDSEKTLPQLEKTFLKLPFLRL